MRVSSFYGHKRSAVFRRMDDYQITPDDLPERIKSMAELRGLEYIRDRIIDYEEPTEANLRICERITDLMAKYYQENDFYRGKRNA
jgi:hypothetical protein